MEGQRQMQRKQVRSYYLISAAVALVLVQKADEGETLLVSKCILKVELTRLDVGWRKRAESEKIAKVFGLSNCKKGIFMY